MALRIGRLDRRITIQQATETVDDGGGVVSVWSDVATVAAEVVPERGIESHQGNQEHAVRETLFRLRYRSGIGEKHRLVYEGKVYDITSVVEVRRREALEITGIVRALP